MPKGYTNKEKIEAYSLQNIDPSFEDRLNEWIESVESFIETYTGRVFIADKTATERKYETKKVEATEIGRYQYSPIDLVIDECAGTGVVSLKIDDVEIDKDNYLLYPANKDPKTRIHLKEDSGIVFGEGEQNISVTAYWGYSVECPKDIEFVATVLTTGIFQRHIGGGELNSVSLGPMSLSYKNGEQMTSFQQAKNILDKYRKI